MKTIYTALIVLSLMNCTSTPNDNTDPVALTSDIEITETQQQAIGIKLGKCKQQWHVTEIKANGKLDVPPQNLYTVAAPMGGFVKNTDLLPGTKVYKGQPLVVLEHPDYIQLQQDYLDTKSQLEFLQLEYQRQQELSVEQVNSTKALQLARSNYMSMKAKVEGLFTKLKFIHIDPTTLENGKIQSTITITSPISGFVTQVHVNRGSYVNIADVMFRLIDTNHLHAELLVFEKDIMQIKVGQSIRVKLSNEPTERMAYVHLIGREIAADRTIMVHGHFKLHDETLIPGIFLTGIIETEKHQAMTLPQQSIVTIDDQFYVFVPNGKLKYHLTKLASNTSVNGTCEITFQSTPPTDVVVEGAYSLLSLMQNSEEK